MKTKPELLAPAGDLDKLRTAIAYGADAVYLGGQAFSLRAGAGNFGEAELVEGLFHAHSAGVRVYVAVNIFARNQDFHQLADYIHWLDALGIDAVIVSDPGVFALVRKVAPKLEVHISTQANTTNAQSAKFWYDLGASRVVLARELSLAEIAEIHDNTRIGLEAFVHGAMCMAWSGRCLISSFLAGRSANRGDCAQPCRWQYHLVEERRPGEFLPLEEDERGTYILNSRDLAMLPYLGELAQSGISSFKIEGRMKSIHYLATVLNAYRVNLDAWWEERENYRAQEAWIQELARASHRPWSTGFYFGNPGEGGQHTQSSRYHRPAAFVAVVEDCQGGWLYLEQRGNFGRGETLEIVVPGQLPLTLTVDELYDQAGTPLERAPHAQQKLKIPWQGRDLPKFTVLRRFGNE